MNYNYKQNKIVVVLSSKLEIGVALNIAGHLAISLGAYTPSDSLMGRPVLYDFSGVKHVGISKYPIIITKVKPERLRRLIHDVRQRDNIMLVDYPEQMLTTGHDDELTKNLSSVPEEKINYLGAILYGESKAVNELTANFTLWR